MRRAILVSVLVLLVSSACSQTAVFRLTTTEYVPTPPTANILLITGDVDREYEEIAILKIFQSTAYSDTLQRFPDALREEARKLGADAVIRIQLDDLGALATGTAVRFKEDRNDEKRD